MINRTNTHQKISTVRCLAVDLFLVLFLVIADQAAKNWLMYILRISRLYL